MKLILLFLSVSIFLVVATSSVNAGKKLAVASLSASGQFLKSSNVVRAYFGNMKRVSKVSYVLMYDGNGIGQGIEGSFTPGKKTSYSKDLFLGTCSRKVCIRHKNIKNMRLEVTTRSTTGKTSKKMIKIR